MFKRMVIILSLSFLPCLFFGAGEIETDNTNNVLSSTNTMELSIPVSRWDEGIPLGNGLCGILMWGKSDQLNLSLDRGDLWDNRPVTELSQAGFNYKTMVDLVKKGDQRGFDRLFDAPYADYPYPTKLSGARLVLNWAKGISMSSLSVDFQKGIGSILFEDGTTAELIFSQKRDGALLIFDQPLNNFNILAPGAKRKSLDTQSYAKFKALNYPQAVKIEEKNYYAVVQSTLDGFSYCFSAKLGESNGKSLMAIAMTTGDNNKNALNSADDVMDHLLAQGEIAIKKESTVWWSKFQSASSLTIPDKSLQAYYNYCEYLYGAGSRRGAPPMPLQGVWTADTEGLPPWKGDFHFDLNMQLNYWGAYCAGLEDSYSSLTDFLWDLSPSFKAFSTEFYGVANGIAVPGVMALDGGAMGGWGQYSLSPVNSAWIAQHFYWQWQYLGDDQFLKEKAYPFCQGVGEFLIGLMEEDDAGCLVLPISTSPEIFDNSFRSWLQPNSNYDLCLMRWLFESLSEMAVIAAPEDQIRWNEIFAKLRSPAVDQKNVLMFSRNEKWDVGHRHHSALIGIYPLQNIDPFGDDSEIVSTSLNQLQENGTAPWVGYSFSWAACLEAAAGRGDHLLSYLNDYIYNFVSRNGFHLNGDQGVTNLASYKGRPFTLEGNFAAMHAIQLALIQNRGDEIALFSALPKEWDSNISFESLRAYSDISVSASLIDSEMHMLSFQTKEAKTIRVFSPYFDGDVLIKILEKVNAKVISTSVSQTQKRGRGAIIEFQLAAGINMQLSE